MLSKSPIPFKSTFDLPTAPLKDPPKSRTQLRVLELRNFCWHRSVQGQRVFADKLCRDVDKNLVETLDRVTKTRPELHAELHAPRLRVRKKVYFFDVTKSPHRYKYWIPSF